MSVFPIVAASVILSLSVQCAAQQHKRQSTAAAERMLATSQDAGELELAVQRLFCDAASGARVSELCCHTNDNVAIQAAWQRVVRTFPKDLVKPKRGGTQARKIDRLALQRFIGFVEGRLQTRVPRWWVKEVATLYSVDRKTLVANLNSSAKGAPFYLDKNGVSTLRGIKAISNVKKQSLKLTFDKFQLDVPRRAIKATDGIDGITAVTGKVTKNICLVAFPSPGPGLYDLWCINRDTGSITWSATVLTGNGPSISGGGGHWAVFVIKGQHVIVFGCTHHSVYIESFSLANGKPRLRFSTGYTPY